MGKELDSKELIERTVAKLTEDTGKVKVREDEHGAVFEIFSTNNSALVGKNHATIESLRVLSKALGYNGKHRIKIVLRENGKETRRTN